MRHLASILLAVSILVVWAGCSIPPDDLARRERERRMMDSLFAVWRSPPPRFPMPDVRPPQFRFKVTFQNGSALDLFRNSYTHDMVLDRDIIVPMTLTAAERDSVYQAMRSFDLFNLPYLWQPDTCPNLTSSWMMGEHYIVQIDTVIRQFDTQWVPDRCSNDTARAISGLRGLIWRLVRAKPVYQMLPSPRGFYR